MARFSIKDATMRSPLMEAQRLVPKTKRTGKRAVVALVLTSLVDAFSILLLYLIVQGNGNGSSLELNKTEQLPMAVKADAVHKGTLVRVEDGRFFLGEEPIEARALAVRLQAIKASQTGEDQETESSLIIQADKNSDFSQLAKVIKAGSVTGFNKFKFAVLHTEGGAQ